MGEPETPISAFRTSFASRNQHANDGAEPATNEWRRIKTLEEAENIAKLARLVGWGLRKKNRNPVRKNPPHLGGKNPPQNPIFKVGKTHHREREKPHHYLYLGAVPQHLLGRRASRRRVRTLCWRCRQRRQSIECKGALVCNCVAERVGYLV
jgi:hypothetical protein